MDAVRFGRALGFGARSAAKTVVQAVDAARAETPGRSPVPSSQTPASSARSGHIAYPQGTRTAPKRGGLLQGYRQFREQAVKPFVRLSGVVMLEVAGAFFAIFATLGISAMWRARFAWHAGSAGHGRFVGGALMVAVFGYFAVTSFVRARRRERRS